MVKVSTSFSMEKSTQAIGRMDLSMAQDFTHIQMGVNSSALSKKG
jgi:hypothetical protein